MMSNEHIVLRLVEPNDLDNLLKWENNPDHWEVSETTSEFSRNTMIQFIASEHDLLKNQQLRFMIVLAETKHVVGTLDLFEYDYSNERVGVGILIGEKEDRKKGYALLALNLLVEKANDYWPLKQIYASMFEDNRASCKLFEKAGFKEIGIRKNWFKSNAGWRDERLMQYIYG